MCIYFLRERKGVVGASGFPIFIATTSFLPAGNDIEKELQGSLENVHEKGKQGHDFFFALL